MIEYSNKYNPIIEYYNWIEKNPKKANKLIKIQLKMLISDIKNKESDVYYDTKKANHAIEFIENFCRNIKGKTAGKLVELDLFQKAFIASIFGICYKKTKLRRTKRAILIEAKKNGKSLIASAIGLYMLIADGEGGPECYSVATQRDQAKIIWNVAKKMIKKDKDLKRYTKTLVSEISCIFNDGIFKPLASDSDTLDGLDIHFVVMDEIHQWKNGYPLYDIMYRGMDNRQQPLALITSTAGTIREDLYDMIYDEAVNILTNDGFEDKKSIFFIYELDKREEMGLFDKVFKPKEEKKDPEKLIGEYFELLNSYTPVFSTFEGSVYEMDLTRSVIHSFATHCSKLNIEVKGMGNEKLARKIKTRANDYIDTAKYLYRLATIREVTNNVFIVPSYDILTEKVDGFYPIYPQNVELIEYKGDLYVRFSFMGRRAAIEYDKIGMLNQFQFKDDFFGEDNRCMLPTMQLLDTQNQGIIEGIKSSAAIRFMAQLANVIRDEDLEKEKERFAKQNLSKDNKTGLMIFDQKYKEVKQIVSTPFTIDANQMRDIKENVYTHFGTNDNILQNKFNSDEWSAYYEGKIEPFAIQASMVHTNLTFTEKQQSFGNAILFTANRLQYLSNQEKLQTATQLFDRGFITRNQGREIFNMAPTEDGDKYYIRKEYAEVKQLDKNIQMQSQGETEDEN